MKILKAPLSYQGGKSRISSKIVDFIQQNSSSFDCFVDVCCGSGAVSIELFNREFPQENLYLFDGGPMGCFWQQVSESAFDLDYFEYLIDKIPVNKNEIQSHLESLSKIEFDYVGEVICEYLILQAGSFGGKQIYDYEGTFRNTSFRSYWQPTATSSRRSPVNPMMPSPHTLLENVKACVKQLSCIRATHTLVEDINFDYIRSKHKSICIYIDPPYEGTTRYGLSFDVHSFIEKAKKYGDVYVSEYKPLSSNYMIMNNTKKGGISGNSKKSRIEYLSKIDS